MKQIAQLTPPEVLAAARPWVDVFSVDDYTLLPGLDDTIHTTWPFYLPHDPTLRNLHDGVGRPLLVMEYSFRAADAGVPNRYPPIFPTSPDQAARAAAADSYLQRLYSAPWMVGDHWFEYVDEPAGGRFDTENSNFGLVSSADVPWTTLVETLTARHAACAGPSGRPRTPVLVLATRPAVGPCRLLGMGVAEALTGAARVSWRSRPVPVRARGRGATGSDARRSACARRRS